MPKKKKKHPPWSSAEMAVVTAAVRKRGGRSLITITRTLLREKKIVGRTSLALANKVGSVQRALDAHARARPDEDHEAEDETDDERPGREAPNAAEQRIVARTREFADAICATAVERDAAYRTHLEALNAQMRERDGALRAQMAEMDAASRTHLDELYAQMRERDAALRARMAEMDAASRTHLDELYAQMRERDAALRARMDERDDTALRAHMDERDAAYRTHLEALNAQLQERDAELRERMERIDATQSQERDAARPSPLEIATTILDQLATAQVDDPLIVRLVASIWTKVRRNLCRHDNLKVLAYLVARTQAEQLQPDLQAIMRLREGADSRSPGEEEEEGAAI